jgi:hypothetical protein
VNLKHRASGGGRSGSEMIATDPRASVIG